MVYSVFGFLAAISLAALVLAAITAAVIHAFLGRRSWLGLPLFAVLWFAALFGSLQIWINYLSEDARRKPEKQSIPPEYLAPALEGIEPKSPQ
jgi:hypothetical protein